MTDHHTQATDHRLLIIGIGNDDRGDDAAGLLIARQLIPHLRHARVLEHNGDGLSLMEAWREIDAVVAIDAVQSGVAPGTIHRLDIHEQPIPSTWLAGSAHEVDVAEAVELARTLGHLPPRFIIYGIEGESFQAGAPLSAAVERAIEKASELVLHEIHRLRKQHRPAETAHR